MNNLDEIEARSKAATKRVASCMACGCWEDETKSVGVIYLDSIPFVTRFRESYPEEAKFFAHAKEDVDALIAYARSLAAWQCQKCGARFEQSISPAMLEGVTCCLSCAENEALKGQVAELEARERWRDVEVELPQLGELQPHETVQWSKSEYFEVLTLDGEFRSAYLRWMKNAMNPYKWMCADGSWIRVTHWRPLPVFPTIVLAAVQAQKGDE